MKRVIVTGASGFIGRHTLKTLVERNFEVYALASKTLPNEAINCQWQLVNLLDFSCIQDLVKAIKPTHLLHFAWNATPGSYQQSDDNFLWIQASLELLKQFREQGGERVVIAGTCAEYDLKYGYCSENLTPKNPSTPYGVCKNAMQELLKSYAQNSTLSSAWGRIFFLYGPYEHPKKLVASVIHSLLKQEDAHCSHGNQIRDFLYVQDVADAFIALLDSEVTGAVNIASGQPITIREIIYKIADQVGRPDLIQLGAIPVSEQEPPLVVADVSRLSKEVKWKPRYSLDLGLETTLQWWSSSLL